MRFAASFLALLSASPAAAQVVAGISPSAFGAKQWREPVASVAALPACNAAASGHLRYAVAEAALYRCNGSAWGAAITGTDTTCNSGSVTCLFAGSASEGGAATTALAFAADPADCTGDQFAKGINAAGVPTCATPAGGGGLAPFDPLSLTGLRLWVRATNAADDSSGEMAAHGDTVRQVTDSSGNKSPLAQGTAGVAPEMYGNATPTGRAALDFDERSPWMAAARSWSAMGSTTELVIVAVVKVDSIARNSATSYANDALVVDSGAWFGIYLKNNAAPKVVAYNWDTNEDQVEVSISLSTWCVITWRHSSGTLGLAVNNGTEVTTASGATADFTGGLRLGMSATSFRGMLAEVIVLSAAQDLTALKTHLYAYYGITP